LNHFENLYACFFINNSIPVLWDIENVQLPGKKKRVEKLTGSQVVLRIESALTSLNLGPINEFKAFADIENGNIHANMRSELQCSNVSIVGQSQTVFNSSFLNLQYFYINFRCNACKSIQRFG